ncbi:MAG: hypothetical protein H7831_16095, partial [Magnetococcus sp. WYHC-3]
PPLLTVSSNSISTRVNGTAVAITANASDPNANTVLTYSITQPGIGAAVLTDYGNGSARIDFTPGATAGNSSLVVTVSDGNLTDSETVNVAAVTMPTTATALVRYSGAESLQALGFSLLTPTGLTLTQCTKAANTVINATAFSQVTNSTFGGAWDAGSGNSTFDIMTCGYSIGASVSTPPQSADFSLNVTEAINMNSSNVRSEVQAGMSVLVTHQ